MAKSLHVMTSIWYHPSLNFASCISTIFFLIFGLGWLTDNVLFAVIASSAIPAALISGIDQPKKYCCKHMLILVFFWGVSYFKQLYLDDAKPAYLVVFFYLWFCVFTWGIKW
ncbi:hypothetical protein JI57_01825 [Psychromonas sp. PRT-SC03]|nr:hypothetical protein JI57_01825 [Psychromonas sp. PRT-SC03]